MMWYCIQLIKKNLRILVIISLFNNQSCNMKNDIKLLNKSDFQKNIEGKTGIYFYTNNKCKIITDDDKLYDDLYSFMFQDKYMYQHYYEVGDIILSDQILSLHKRDQNDPALLAERVLHRITFRISNTGRPTWFQTYNNFDVINNNELGEN